MSLKTGASQHIKNGENRLVIPADFPFSSLKWSDAVKVNVLNLEKCSAGKLSDTSGEILPDKTYFVSDWIPAAKGNSFTYPAGEDRCICCYDASQKFISGDLDTGWTGQVTKAVTGRNTAYLRISYKTASFDVWNPMICAGKEYYSEYVQPGITIPWLERNPLKGKSMGVLGDSICALHKSYINAVAYQNNMDFIRWGNNDGISDNQSVWGSPITPHTIPGEPESFLKRFEALIQPGGAWEKKGYQYLVIHGGTNDARLNIPLGTMTEDQDFSGDLDTFTYYGALESLFRQAQTKFIGCKIVFVTTYKIQHLQNLVDYMQAAKRVCLKYSVPVLDFFNLSGLNMGLADVWQTYWSDNTHLNEWGHLYLVPAAQAFLKNYGAFSG